MKKVYYHLPGLFEFYEFYQVFLPYFETHRSYFYEQCEIGSIYGAPSDCLWGGGRCGFGEAKKEDVFALLKKYHISARLTFSNSLLKEEHLSDYKCNQLSRLFEDEQNGIIISSDLLLDYMKKKYPKYYFVSSTTKVLTDFYDFKQELDKKDFAYVVPDFRLNKSFDKLTSLTEEEKNKTEFLLNECCYIGCRDRFFCYEAVSRKNLGEETEDFICKAPDAKMGYRFSLAKKNPSFISKEDILEKYVPMGFTNFKIEGRSLGSAILLEFILYYMVKKEYELTVREDIYLDSALDLF